VLILVRIEDRELPEGCLQILILLLTRVFLADHLLRVVICVEFLGIVSLSSEQLGIIGCHVILLKLLLVCVGASGHQDVGTWRKRLWHACRECGALIELRLPHIQLVAVVFPAMLVGRLELPTSRWRPSTYQSSLQVQLRSPAQVLNFEIWIRLILVVPGLEHRLPWMCLSTLAEPDSMISEQSFLGILLRLLREPTLFLLFVIALPGSHPLPWMLLLFFSSRFVEHNRGLKHC